MLINHYRSKVARRAAIRKILSGIFLSMIIPFAILYSLYGRLNDKIIDQNYERDLSILQSGIWRVEQLFDNMDQVAVYLGDNDDIIRFYRSDLSQVQNKQSVFLYAQQVLKSVCAGNNNFLNLQLYSENSRTIIDYDTISFYPKRYYKNNFYLEGVDYEDFCLNYLQCTDLIQYSQNTAYGHRFGLGKDVIIYNVRQIGSNLQKGNRAIFYISKDNLLELFSSLAYQSDGFFCLMDEQKEPLILHTGAEQDECFDFTLLDFSLLRDRSGYITMNVDGHTQYLMYCYSDNRNLLSMELVPEDTLLSVTNQFRNTMFLLLWVALAVGILALVFSSLRIASPAIEIADILRQKGNSAAYEDVALEVRKLIQSNDSLKLQMQDQMSAIKHETFYKLLCNNQFSEKEIFEVLENVGVPVSDSIYGLLIIHLNDISIDMNIEELSLQRMLIETSLRNQHCPEIRIIVFIDFERIAVCMSSNSMTPHSFQLYAENMVRNVQEYARSDTGMSISVSGDVVDSPLKLSKAFAHAQLALKVSQNIFGGHPVQWYDRAKQFASPEIIETNSSDENVSLQNKIFIEKIKNFINENYTNSQLSLKMVGEEFYITEVYLSKLFKKATGENFSKYVEKIRMSHAKELLEQNHKISEVAEMIGYNSPQVFRRAWKRYCEESDK